MSTTKKKSKVRYGPISFDIYIYRVLKQVHPDTGISTTAKDELNSVVNYLGQILAQAAVDVANQNKRATISTRDIQSAVYLRLPGELAKHAVSEGVKAIFKFNESESAKGTSTSARAGLQFSISRSRKFFSAYNKRIGGGAPVYLAAVLEYLVAEVLELAGNRARDNKRKRITVRDIFSAVETDEELIRLFEREGIQLGGTGVMPSIHSSLLPEKGKKSKNKKSTGGPRKFLPGTVALRDIRKQQKQSECIYFGKLPFQRFVREVAQDFKDDLNFSQDAMIALQIYIEQKLVHLLNDANMVAIHASRQTVFPKDIQLARKLGK